MEDQVQFLRETDKAQQEDKQQQSHSNNTFCCVCSKTLWGDATVVEHSTQTNDGWTYASRYELYTCSIKCQTSEKYSALIDMWRMDAYDG
jgi:hypothetical protein